MPVQPTSIEAYRHGADTGALSRLRALVLRELSTYHTRHHAWPTSYELFEQMKADHLVRDLNDVRPKLTELKRLRRVENPEIKRACAVTGRRAFTWRPAFPDRLF
jgi:hypothetical protein